MEERMISGGKKTIRVNEQDMIDMLNEIGSLEKYSFCFNKIVNKALKYGVPILYEKEILKEDFGNEKKEEVKEKENTNELYKAELDGYLKKNVKLMKEVVINTTIIKSIVSSLYNTLICELDLKKISKEELECGEYRNTPSYLENYERKAFKDLLEEE